MQANTSEKKLRISFQSAKSKVLAGFALASIALVLFWLGTRFVFGAALQNMEELSQPNNKLTQVHTLFQDFTRVDQLQRHIAVQNKPGRRKKISELSAELQRQITSLKNLYQAEESQYQRLDSIQQVIKKREQLFWDFIQHRDELMSSRSLTAHTQNIAQLIASSEPYIDSSLQVTHYRQSVKTMSSPDTIVRTIAIERQGNFLNRLFGKKQLAEVEEVYFPSKPEVIVEETIDSIVQSQAILIQEDTILPKLEAQLQEMLEQQRTQAANMAWSELEFLKTSNLLTNEILYMLYEIEEEELRNIEDNRASLSKLIHSSFGLFNGLLVGILFCLACLAFLILIDFSKSRRYRAQLVQAKKEAERLGQVKERFLSNMSHEIRTPLQSIIGYAEQIQKQERPIAFDKQAIHQSARHLLQIVNEILDYNRLVSGRFQLEAQPFDLQEVLEEVGTSMRAQAENKGLEFATKLEIEPGSLLLGDAFRLRQILYNLLGNAIKFTETGCISLSAKLQGNDAYYHFQLRVEDTGIGISEDSLKHIFNQFEQAPGLDYQRYGGTGLGLSIVKALVETQGGDIQVESKPGVGSKFTVSLQYPRAAMASLQNEQIQTHAFAEPDNLAGTVLVVDDDQYTLNLCQRVLSSRGYKVAAFSSAGSLLEAGAFRTGDVVLTDIRLPGMSGYQLLEKLRDIGAPTAIIAMTAQALPEEQQAMRQAGFDKILVKPFTEHELIQAVNCVASPAESLPSPGEPAKPLFSLNFGGEEGLREIFVEESDKDLNALSAAMGSNDAEAAAAALHRLAGRSGQFGFSAWYQRLRRLEICLQGQAGLEGYRPEIESLHEEIHGALTGLKAYS
jgi:CheY-like chemotaxis protein/HPt (histidine-containing phosphotransfer) domain-containing protein